MEEWKGEEEKKGTDTLDRKTPSQLISVSADVYTKMSS